ncbi:MAG: YheT family hydrolase [Planctomycetota bacterium]
MSTHKESDPRLSVHASPEAYRPPWYLRSGHFQTLITGFYRPLAQLPPAIVHRIEIGEFGAMLIHENAPEAPADDAPSVLLLHGLGSSHAGTYMTSITQGLLARGCRVFRADLPGAGPSCRTTYLPPHGACFDLVRTCVNTLSRTQGIRSWRMTGVSLGGNILLKMLARNALDPETYPFDFEVDYVLSVAPPIDLAACCENIERGINRMYGRYFMRILKIQARQRAALWPQWQKVLETADYRTLRRFDETVTAPLAGFPSGDAYYRFGSSIDELHGISVPTTILIDEHDPIVPSFLFDRASYSATTRLVKTQYGGHVGYLHRASGADGSAGSRWRRWADDRIAAELAKPTWSTEGVA